MRTRYEICYDWEAKGMIIFNVGNLPVIFSLLIRSENAAIEKPVQRKLWDTSVHRHNRVFSLVETETTAYIVHLEISGTFDMINIGFLHFRLKLLNNHYCLKYAV